MHTALPIRPAHCRKLLALILLALTALLLPACSSSSSLTATSLESGATLPLTLPTAAYRQHDDNTIDVYLTDLSRAELAAPSVAHQTGHIMHIHVFLIPSAGRTPINPTACNVTVRHAIISGGAVGIYGGGGFVLPSSSVLPFSSSRFNATVQDASLKLIRVGPGFADKLSPASLTGDISAANDEQLARLIGTRLDQLIQSLPPSPPSPPASPSSPTPSDSQPARADQ